MELMEIKETWKRQTGYTIRDIDISANGEYVIVGSFDYKVYLFDRTGTLLWDYRTGDTVRDVAITFDGRFMAAGSYDNHVYFFNTAGDLLWKFATGKPVRDISISARGEYLVVGSNDEHVYFLDRNGDLLWKYRTGGSVTTVALSMNGEYVAAGSKDRNVYYFDRSGALLWRYGTGSMIQDVEMTTKGRYIAAGSFDKYLYFLDRGGNLLWKRMCDSRLQKVAISPLGDEIAVGGEGEVILFNQNGELMWRHSTGEYEIRGLEISTQGGSIICGSRDNELLYFDRSGRVLWRYSTQQWVETVSVSSRGRFIVAGLRNGVLFLFDSLEFFRNYLEEARRGIVKLRNFGSDAVDAESLYQTALREFERENYMRALALAIRVRDVSISTMERNRPQFSYRASAEAPFRSREWTPVNLTLSNDGTADSRDILIKFTGPVRCRGELRIPFLRTDETRTIRIDMMPQSAEDGRIELIITYFDFHGREYEVRDTATIQVSEPTGISGPRMPDATRPSPLLFNVKVGKSGRTPTSPRSDPICPNCAKDIRHDWIVCPYCTTSLR